ncbi:MAG: hypothetical protein MJ192_04960 [Clostridia bacterium]|nr:hypothetical protein [Clostridia bacterium]
MSESKNIIEELWTPLEVSSDGERVRIGCFGRSYDMDGPLPVRITSGGSDVLAGSARLRVGISGAEAETSRAHTYVVEQSEDRLVYTHQAAAGNVLLNSRVTVERDGLIWVDLMLLPATAGGVMGYTFAETVIGLDSLVLELPIRRDVAGLYHYWPVTEGSALSNSGSVPEKGLSLAFRPHLWIGTETAGLSFYAESDENWQSADPRGVITLDMTDEAAVLRVHLLDERPAAWLGRSGDNWGDALEPVRFSFGLQATPVKPYRPVGDYRRVCHKGLACGDKAHPYDLDTFEREADELKSAGVVWRTFHEDWSMIQNYGLPEDEALFRAKVDALHERGMKAMVYFGYEYASCAPGFMDDYRQALLLNANGSLRGGWQRLPAQRDYIVCYNGPYADTLFTRICRAMETYGVDGIYTDGTYVPWDCANAAHGCGYTDREGVRHETWPLRAVRAFVQRLYCRIHAMGGIIEAHQSSCVMPMILAYCDSYWDGEHIALTSDPVTGAFRGLTGRELIEKYTSGTGSGVGTMRAEFTGVNFGIPCQFLSYAPTFDECSGLTLLYGVLPKPGGNMDSIREAARHWRIMEKYGLTEAGFIPFWREDCPVRSADNRITCSVWEIPDGLAAVFVNLSGEPAEADFTCTRPVSAVLDAETGRTLPSLRVSVSGPAPVYVVLKS